MREETRRGKSSSEVTARGEGVFPGFPREMTLCGHQFHGGDESDWILSTSVSCLDGSTTASQILQELFKTHSHNMPNKTSRKRPKMVTEGVSSTKSSLESNRTSSSKEENEGLTVKKINGVYGFQDFDESQHLNGCPIKWLYRKKLLEKNKVYKIERLCKRTVKKEEVKKEKRKNVRDRTPAEVKIRRLDFPVVLLKSAILIFALYTFAVLLCHTDKINLTERYTDNSDEMWGNTFSEKCNKEAECQRKNLAGKLNWKLHDESQDDPFETISEISFRHNYLPPRPLLGLKPLLSVLLAPQQKTRCCSLIAMQDLSPRKKKAKASLTIQSLHLPISQPETKPRPKTTVAPRRSSKSSSKTSQLPGHPATKTNPKPILPNSPSEVKVVCYNPPGKKLTERTKQTKSLSSLFYELKGKTNYAHQNEEYFEELIRDLTMDEGQFKIKRFLNVRSMDLIGKGHVEAASPEDLICEKVRFFDKKSAKMAKQEEMKMI